MSSTLTMPQPITRATPYADGDDPRLFRRARTWFLLVALFLLAQANGIFTDLEAHYTLKALKKVHETGTLLPLTIATALICVGLILQNIGPTLRMMLRQRAILAFAVLALASTVWSEVPFQTFRKAVLLSIIFALAWFCSIFYSPRDQMRIILATGAIVAAASIAMAVLLPQYGISPRGEWKGIFGQKNHLGIGIFYLFSALPFSTVSSRGRRILIGLQAIVPISLILLSQSRNALIMAMLMVGFRLMAPTVLRTRREHVPFMLYMLIFSMAAAIAGMTVILPLLGRDLSFTGRTREWPIIFPFALRHFWLGYGYQGFWIGDTGESGRVAAMLGAHQNAADNGYLELMLQFGIAGIALLAVLLKACIRDCLKLLDNPYVTLPSLWYVGLIIATFVGSFAESLFWTPSSQIASFIFVLACAGLTKNCDDGLPLSARETSLT